MSNVAPQKDSGSLYPVWVIVTTSDDRHVYVIEFGPYDKDGWQTITRTTDGLNLGRRRIDSIYPTQITWERPDGTRVQCISTRDADHAMADYIYEAISAGLAR